ncbi:MAG: hypothetical protein DMG75_12755 [Acidobacteria bacterium]|nr:MAG: hypothetical protein DMG75_12755 [Acidobacteriota bacterium]
MYRIIGINAELTMPDESRRTVSHCSVASFSYRRQGKLAATLGEGLAQTRGGYFFAEASWGKITL